MCLFEKTTLSYSHSDNIQKNYTQSINALKLLRYMTLRFHTLLVISLGLALGSCSNNKPLETYPSTEVEVDIQKNIASIDQLLSDSTNFSEEYWLGPNGEYLYKDENDRLINLYMIYDLYIFHGDDVKNLNLMSRKQKEVTRLSLAHEIQANITLSQIYTYLY